MDRGLWIALLRGHSRLYLWEKFELKSLSTTERFLFLPFLSSLPRSARFAIWTLRKILLLALIALDDSVLNKDHSVSIFGDVVLVGYQHDGISLPVQAVE
jgi:hypothetical protein